MVQNASFYLGTAKKEWDIFKEICIREGTTASKKIVEYIIKYNDKHRDGNPQTMLDYAGEVKTLPRYKTCPKSSGKLLKGTFWCEQHSHSHVPKACDRCDDYPHVLRMERLGMLK